MSDLLGGLTGMLGGGFGQQAQQQGLSQQQGPLTVGSFATTNNALTIDAPFGVSPNYPTVTRHERRKASPETALAWLDRRVEEMRVEL